MAANGWLQIVLYFAVLLALAKPLGAWMAHVYENRSFGRLERLIYRLAGVRPEEEMDWKVYAFSMLLFSVVGVLFLYGLQRLQGALPWNPQSLGAVTPDSSFNTAVSFISNTNWQGYGGETTVSYLTQMVGLTVQNFVSAAAGMAMLVALIRGLVRRQAATIGNFWVDLTRTILYILLPLSLILALVLVSQGVVQTFSEYRTEPLLESGTPQVLALGPAASQIAIKQIGTNGGGFFNVNSAHPFENPTPLSNFLEMLLILLIPAALC
jgi:K+-transporting ATPase ATPase A chain